MKTLFLITAATLAIAAPSFAAPGPVQSVTDGQRVISYTVDRRDDGSLVLASAPREASRFRLRVKDGWVSGDVAGMPVSFRTTDARAVRAAAD